jgi:hypothetical protein
MVIGGECGRQLVELAKSSREPEAFALGEAIAAVRSHPRFRDAVQRVLTVPTSSMMVTGF